MAQQNSAADDWMASLIDDEPTDKKGKGKPATGGRVIRMDPAAKAAGIAVTRRHRELADEAIQLKTQIKKAEARLEEVRQQLIDTFGSPDETRKLHGVKGEIMVYRTKDSRSLDLADDDLVDRITKAWPSLIPVVTKRTVVPEKFNAACELNPELLKLVNVVEKPGNWTFKVTPGKK